MLAWGDGSFSQGLVSQTLGPEDLSLAVCDVPTTTTQVEKAGCGIPTLGRWRQGISGTHGAASLA